MRQLPRTDGILRHRTHMVHRLLHPQILHQGREGHETHIEGQRLPGNGRILHPRPPRHRILQDSTERRAGHHQGRSRHLRMHHQHNAPDRPPPAQQPLRPRSGPFRLLRLHHRLEHVRGARPLPHLPRPRHLLPRAVAPLHPRHSIPRRTRNAPHALLTQCLLKIHLSRYTPKGRFNCIVTTECPKTILLCHDTPEMAIGGVSRQK